MSKKLLNIHYGYQKLVSEDTSTLFKIFWDKNQQSSF